MKRPRAVEPNPVNINILNTGEDLRTELTQIAKLVCAICNTGCKGRIQLKNVKCNERPSVENMTKWKNIVSLVLRDLQLGGSQSKFFHFSQNTESDERLFLYIRPTEKPLVLHEPLHLPLEIRTTQTLQRMQEDMNATYSWYLLNEREEVFPLTETEVWAKMEEFNRNQLEKENCPNLPKGRCS